MLELSEDLYTFLQSQSVFTAKMGTKLSPIVAMAGVDFPFTTYKLSEQISNSCDGTAAAVQLFFWFSANEYKKCAAFTDAMKPIIESKTNYDWQSSSIDFLEENQSFYGIINFNTN